MIFSRTWPNLSNGVTQITLFTNVNYQLCRIRALVVCHNRRASEEGVDTHTLRFSPQTSKPDENVTLANVIYRPYYGSSLIGRTIRVFWSEYNNW